MTREREIDAAIKSVDPAEIAAVERLPLSEARRELLAGIVSDAKGRELDGATARAARRPVRRRRLALGGAIAAAAATVLVALGIGLGSGEAPSPAFGAALERLARFSPNILVDLPGWRAEAAYRVSGEVGTIRYHRGGKVPEALLGGRLIVYSVESARLEWKSAEPRAALVPPTPTAVLLGDRRVLGHAASIYVRPARRGATKRYLFADWSQSGREIEFSSLLEGRRSFYQLLSSLSLVDRNAWLGALPPGGLVTRGGWAASKPWGEPANSSITFGGCTKPLPDSARAGAPEWALRYYERACGRLLPKAGSQSGGAGKAKEPGVVSTRRCDYPSEELSLNATQAIDKQLEAEGKCHTVRQKPDDERTSE